MRYPTLSLSKCRTLTTQLVNGADVTIDAHVQWVGLGDEVDLGPIEEVARSINRRATEWTDKDRDRFEGLASVRLYEAFAEVPVDVLDDRGFWRYLALRFFWSFIVWREEQPFARGNYHKYVDATLGRECVLTRMYLRASAVRGDDAADLASGVPRAADFWRSHVVRVRTGSVPAIARAFSKKQCDSRLTTNPLREAARRLNRTWANVVLNVYDEREASSLIDAIWVQTADD